MNEIVQIACASDDRYFVGLVATVSSILTNIKPGCKAVFHILDGGVKSTNKKKLEEIVSIYGNKYELNWLNTNLNQFSGLPDFWYDSKVNYARLLLPKLLDIDKVVYTDIDILHFKDISELWNINSEDKAALVCREITISVIKNDCPRCKEEDLDPDAPYFNNGLMLINLDYWRKHQISKKIIDYLNKYPDACRFHEQSAMNVVLHNQFFLLDQSWNVQSHREAFQLEKDFDKLYNFCINYHFVTSFKPWLYYNDSPQNLLFYKLIEIVAPNILGDHLKKSMRQYNLKKRFYAWLPFFYNLRAKFQWMRNKSKAYESDTKIAEFWKDQKPIIRHQNSIKKKIDDIVKNWEYKIRVALEK